ncbi:MAG: hypothetical protein A2Z02_01210 [Chloroflexi bacterium RBG_16_48_7]|nr:MAG: hypothetical protein A2Z02_01210 [Chloroflexi bacterium RBG_16_48_7]
MKPKINVVPPSAVVGKPMTVNGTGFPAKDQGIVMMDGLAPGMVFTATDNGSFSVSFPIPETIAGTHKIVANSTKLTSDVANVNFAIGPAIKLSPEKPDVGSEAQLIGNGFAANSQVSITYNSNQMPNPPVTDAKGNFTYMIKIVESANKAPDIIATDKAGNSTKFGMLLESTAPPKPAIVSPKDRDQTFGFMGSETITFKWSPVQDASGVSYTVEVGDNLEFFPLKPGMRKDALSGTSATMQIPPGTYFWRVRAVDGVGNEGEWAISPNFFKVGVISFWYLLGGGIVILIVFVLLIRAFVTRLKAYYG